MMTKKDHLKPFYIMFSFPASMQNLPEHQVTKANQCDVLVTGALCRLPNDYNKDPNLKQEEILYFIF